MQPTKLKIQMKIEFLRYVKYFITSHHTRNFWDRGVDTIQMTLTYLALNVFGINLIILPNCVAESD